MSTLYLFTTTLGLLGLLVSAFGLGTDHHDGFAGDSGGDDGHAVGHGLNLISIKTLTTALSLFGLVGGLVHTLETPWWLSMPAGIAAGLVAAWFVAIAMQQMKKLEQDNSVDASGAVGESAQVYLPIPAHRAGQGKVTVTVQHRILELPAVTAGDALSTGTPVLVTGVRDGVAEVVVLKAVNEGENDVAS